LSLPENFMAELAATKDSADEFCQLIFGLLPGHKHALHAGQRRYVENAVAEVNFLLPGNSYGKTEFILRSTLYEAWHKTGHPTPFRSFEDWYTAADNSLIASYNYPIAKESFTRFEQYYRSNEKLRALVSKVDRSDPPEVHLTNGSIIRWGSLDGQGKLVEATRYNRIKVDEAGHIPDLSTTFDSILYPRTMGVGGRVHLFGTPKPHSDPYLLEIFEKGKTGEDPFYFAQSGSVFENEFWPQSEKDRVLANPRYVTGWRKEHAPGEPCDNLACRDGAHPILTTIGRQVILGHFTLAGGFFFNRMHVARVFTPVEGDDSEPQWDGENHFWLPPKAGRLYAGAWDLAGNKQRRRKKPGSDPTVGFVVDYTTRPWQIVYYRYIEGGDADWEQKYALMAETFHRYGMPYLSIDATGQIDSVAEALQQRGVEVNGVTFGGNSNKKFDMLRNLQVILEMEWSGTRGLLRSPLIGQLKYELDHYVLPDDDIRQDCIMALAMVCHDIAQYELPAPVAGDVW
jgi:hypothetical protein